MKRIFVVDWSLLFLFLLTAGSGIALHVAGHGHHYGAGHGHMHCLWHARGMVHIIFGFLFLFVSVMHVKMHWGWFKRWKKEGLGERSRVTAMLAVLFVTVVITGVMLLAVCGCRSGVGLLHYRLGLFFLVLSVAHVLKRWNTLRKSLK